MEELFHFMQSDVPNAEPNIPDAEAVAAIIQSYCLKQLEPVRSKIKHSIRLGMGFYSKGFNCGQDWDTTGAGTTSTFSSWPQVKVAYYKQEEVPWDLLKSWCFPKNSQVKTGTVTIDRVLYEWQHSFHQKYTYPIDHIQPEEIVLTVCNKERQNDTSRFLIRLYPAAENAPHYIKESGLDSTLSDPLSVSKLPPSYDRASTSAPPSQEFQNAYLNRVLPQPLFIGSSSSQRETTFGMSMQIPSTSQFAQAQSLSSQSRNFSRPSGAQTFPTLSTSVPSNFQTDARPAARPVLVNRKDPANFDHTVPILKKNHEPTRYTSMQLCSRPFSLFIVLSKRRLRPVFYQQPPEYNFDSQQHHGHRRVMSVDSVPIDGGEGEGSMPPPRTNRTNRNHGASGWIGSSMRHSIAVYTPRSRRRT